MEPLHAPPAFSNFDLIAVGKRAGLGFPPEFLSSTTAMHCLRCRTGIDMHNSVDMEVDRDSLLQDI